jgi:hypothetical protein
MLLHGPMLRCSTNRTQLRAELPLVLASVAVRTTKHAKLAVASLQAN